MATKAELRTQLDKADISYGSKNTTKELQALLDSAPPPPEVPSSGGGDIDTTTEPKPVRAQKLYEWKQDHILIKISVTTMDGQTSSRQKMITNPEGCVIMSQVNNAEGYFTTLFGGLIKKYGARHIE